MKKSYLFAFATATALTVSCSNDELVNEMGTRKVDQTPIGFNVQKQNITRAVNLETVKHYNFGVWAWKVQGKNNLADAEVMNNYLVGWSNGTNKGYDKTTGTTWSDVTTAPTDHLDHLSPWFYEGLGTAEYTYEGNDGFYKKTDTDYMSKNANQYLRYWDLAYEKTNFYCYAPYNKEVTFSHVQNGTSTMTFDAKKTIRDGYDLPHNTAYNDYSRTLGEFMYATKVQSTNANLADVTVPFKHMGAQLFIRFYENIPGYKVEIIELNGDHGKTKDGLSGDILTGIQATPAVASETGTPYTPGRYYTTSGATITFDETDAKATYTPSWEGSTTATNTTPLMFKIPSPATDYETYSVAPGNLTEYQGLGETKHNIIPEAGASPQTYAYSPTIYYPVAQPTSNDDCTKTGFTFHISYRIIAEDNKEVITVHNATVHVPYKGKATTGTTEAEATEKSDQWITIWQPNVKYTYTFKFTRETTGTTNPDGTPTDTDPIPFDPTDPTPSTTKSLYPIVFDEATIEDFEVNNSEYIVSEGTNYNHTVTP